MWVTVGSPLMWRVCHSRGLCPVCCGGGCHMWVTIAVFPLCVVVAGVACGLPSQSLLAQRRATCHWAAVDVAHVLWLWSSCHVCHGRGCSTWDRGCGLCTHGMVPQLLSMRHVHHVMAFMCHGRRCSASRCGCRCHRCGACIMVVAFVLHVVSLLPFSHCVGCRQCLHCVRCGVVAAARGAAMGWPGGMW
jgi:hypothetical protein